MRVTRMVQRRAVGFLFNDYSRSSSVSSMIGTLGWNRHAIAAEEHLHQLAGAP